MLAAVLLVHGLAAWLLSRPVTRTAAAARATVTLRIIAPPARPAPPEPAAAAPRRDDTPPARSAARQPAPRRSAPEPPPRELSRAPTEPAGLAPQAITLPPAPPPAASAPLPEPPLRLELPRGGGLARGAPRHPALDDPRANTARAGFGERLAGAIGTDDTLREEARGDGRVRFRQGRDCIDVRPSRAAGLDPFNGSVRPAPKQGEPC